MRASGGSLNLYIIYTSLLKLSSELETAMAKRHPKEKKPKAKTKKEKKKKKV